MSYTLTLDMPPEVVKFAERQATRAGTDFSALFLAFQRTHFGYDEEDAARGAVAVGPITQSLSGIVHLPDDVSDKDLLAEAMLEKYGALS